MNNRSLYKFKIDERMFLANLVYGIITEVDEVVWKVADLYCSHSRPEIIDKIAGSYSENEINQALEILDSFSLGQTEHELAEGRLRIIIPERDFVSGMAYGASGANIAVFHLVKAMAKYADIYFAGDTERKIAEGFYSIPLKFSERMDLSLNFIDRCDGILIPDVRRHRLYSMFRYINVPIVIQLHCIRGSGGKMINSVLRYYAEMRDFDALAVLTSSVKDFFLFPFFLITVFVATPSLNILLVLLFLYIFIQEKLAEFRVQVGDTELVRLCLQEWRLEKDATQKGKGNKVETCQGQLEQWEAAVVKRARETVRWLLGKVVRASSLVETVNSWLRPFLWRRKGNGRGIYNLLKLCWNTHRFARGKRQGKTPLELAGIEVGKDDWLELVGFAPKASTV